MKEIVFAFLIYSSKQDSVLCPPYPYDPPWRKYTCYIMSRLAIPQDRPRYIKGKEYYIRTES